MKIKQRYIEASYAVALSSQGVGGDNRDQYKVGAVLIIDNRIISAINSYKTHPLLVKYYEYPYLHAEAACLVKYGFDNCKNGIIYVTRVKRNKTVTIAKPCKECQSLMKSAGINTVVYSTTSGNYEFMDLQS